MICGATVKMSDKIELYVLNLQTSALTSYFHHIITLWQNLIIINVSNTEETEKFVDIVQMHWTCKVGSNYSFKHVVAVLLL